MMKLIIISRWFADEEDSSVCDEVMKTNVAQDLKYTFVYPKDKISYKIDQIKQFTLPLTRKPVDEDHIPAYVLMRADKLSPICQNALLKTLEESPYSIILASRNLDSLLSTVRSRCQIQYLEDNQDKNVQNVEKLDLRFESIPAIAKYERDTVKQLLENELLLNTNPSDFEKILAIQNALSKVEANCKIESVLFELIGKLKVNN